jgi:hypothetical protein
MDEQKSPCQQDYHLRLDATDQQTKHALPLAYIRTIGFSDVRGSLGIQVKLRWEDWFSHEQLSQKKANGGTANLFTLGGDEFGQSHVCVQFGYDFNSEQAFIRLGPYWMRLPFFIEDTLHYHAFPHRDNNSNPDRRWWWLRIQIRNVGPGKRPSVYVSTRPVEEHSSLLQSYYVHRSFPIPGPDSLLHADQLSFFGALKQADIDSFPVSVTQLQIWHNTANIHPMTLSTSLPDKSQTAVWDWQTVYELTPNVLMIPPLTHTTKQHGYVYITLQ